MFPLRKRRLLSERSSNQFSKIIKGSYGLINDIAKNYCRPINKHFSLSKYRTEYKS